mgnify:CR=1 FL=1
MDRFDAIHQRKSLEKCGLDQLPAPSGQEYRASVSCVCEICGNDYGSHPDDHRLLGYNDRPVFVIICNGDRVKL